MTDALNKGFIRVYGGGPTSLPIVGLQQPGRIFPAVIGVPGESMSAYIAYNVSGGLSLTDGSGNSFGGGGSASGFAITGGTHSILNFTVPSVPDGTYKMTIGGMESNYIDIVSDVAYANQVSCVVEYFHNKILGPYYYPYASSGYKQKLRLRMTLLDRQPETNVDGYEATNTGKQRNLQGVYKEYITLQTVDYLLEDHQAASLMSMHDSISINGILYIRRPSGGYKMSPSMDTPVSNGEFSLYDNSSTFLLRC